MILQLGEEIERLQAVDAERLEKVLVGRKFFARDFEVRGCKRQNLVKSLICGWHSLILSF
jgi:hypothetical protein